MTIKNVTVLGTGVLGAQIAFQTAFKGFNVTAYDINDEAVAKAEKFLAYLDGRYRNEVAGADDASLAATKTRFRFSTDLADAVKDADLVIEAVPEKIEIKRDVYTKLGAVAPDKTIFASNSSTLLPSAMAESTGRPEKFLALHFANEIWANNIGEVMGHPGTSPEAFKAVSQFASDIGMVPIEIHKEQPGYVLNSLLVPLLRAAGQLLVNGIADPEAIDNTWKIGTKSPRGPFEIFDIIGLNTVYAVSSTPGSGQENFAAYVKERYLDKGKLGITTGEGFYKYPRT